MENENGVKNSGQQMEKSTPDSKQNEIVIVIRNGVVVKFEQH